MSDYETLKECKTTYEILNDLLVNCDIISDEDIKTRNKIKETINVLEDLYQNAYELITSNKDTCNQIETSFKCPRCGNSLIISDLIDYAYLCEECDENYYYSECEVDYAWWLKDDKDYLKIAITQKVYDYLNNVECENDKQMEDFDKLETDTEMISKIVNEIIKDLEYNSDFNNNIEWFINKAIGGEL